MNNEKKPKKKPKKNQKKNSKEIPLVYYLYTPHRLQKKKEIRFSA
jgi:ABC-type proline/glycine betaine transport system substrate-binding protein